MKHLRHSWCNESVNVDVVRDIMNIAIDDPMFFIEHSTQQYGFKYNVIYNIYKRNNCDNTHIIKVCRNIHDRLGNEDIEHRMSVKGYRVEMSRYKASSEYTRMIDAYEPDDDYHNMLLYVSLSITGLDSKIELKQ